MWMKGVLISGPESWRAGVGLTGTDVRTERHWRCEILD